MKFSKPFLYILLAALTLKAIYFIYGNRNAIIGTETYDNMDQWFQIFSRNDSGWYQKIAENGHEKVSPESLKGDWRNQSYYAFFPLFPLLVSIVMKLGLTFNVAGFLLNSILSVIVFWLLFKWLQKQGWVQNKSLFGVFLFMLFPFHYCFSMTYTESLFMVLLLSSFHLLQEKKFFGFAITSALLVLVRPNGFVMIIPFFIYWLEQDQPSLTFKNFIHSSLTKLFSKEMIWFLIPPITFLGYCFYLKQMTGDFFAFATAQGGWGKSTTFPIFSLKQTFTMGWKETLEGLWTVLIMIIAIAQLKKWPIWTSSFIWINTLMPLSGGAVQGMLRYSSVMFPMHQLIANWTFTKKPVLWLLLFFILHMISFHFWTISHPLSY